MDKSLPRNFKKHGLRVAARVLRALRDAIEGDEYAGVAYSERRAIKNEKIMFVLITPTRHRETTRTYSELLKIEDPDEFADNLLQIFREDEK